MSWTAPRTWVTGEVVTAAMMNTHVRDNTLDLDRRSTLLSATVATSETTATTTYTDLATSGPAVTVTTGVSVIIILSVQVSNSLTNGRQWMGFGITGATTRVATDTQALAWQSPANTAFIKAAQVLPVTGLTAGSNTFTAKYRTEANTATYVDRFIAVLPLLSA